MTNQYTDQEREVTLDELQAMLAADEIETLVGFAKSGEAIVFAGDDKSIELVQPNENEIKTLQQLTVEFTIYEVCCDSGTQRSVITRRGRTYCRNLKKPCEGAERPCGVCIKV